MRLLPSRVWSNKGSLANPLYTLIITDLVTYDIKDVARLPAQIMRIYNHDNAYRSIEGQV